ncbi:hypothetical protein DdX_11262 [Ditylenchus destructor]|uniref:Uncharacterized protein n=1 Tax=Ditylenchus destructor TaxID=166010 RepID=A0AAD4QYD1_9BILA|nr:hypothetical protein DdX_11262 [Ditylenchus destructor]
MQEGSDVKYARAYFIGGEFGDILTNDFVKKTGYNVGVRILSEHPEPTTLQDQGMVKEYLWKARFGAASYGNPSILDLKEFIEERKDSKRLEIAKFDLDWLLEVCFARETLSGVPPGTPELPGIGIT